jgi:hypothetical protein
MAMSSRSAKILIFTHLSADYRLRRLVNNVAVHIYTHDYIRMEITAIPSISNTLVSSEKNNNLELYCI